ncbi:MAG: hypothetical protein A2Z06_03890 [Candidatus Glassbacteria bacterium RBG_16_58_8]|uniref:Uncharacterized protein n=1 Tax=Candidatus Glassbacteria bacterium RBG_16_58_8 TaxID=1817866 RepID=A0A1F5YB70_9BACT|nr:MAG: hypothetical protein A2Z06_03890 [Candidatus Glassbacteria bacterium RBG_16_58_8]
MVFCHSMTRRIAQRPANIRTPKTMKRDPATYRITSVGTKRITVLPISTARSVVRRRAQPAPTITSPGEREPAANENMASCVLSPSSARKIMTKVPPTIFQSTDPSLQTPMG